MSSWVIIHTHVELVSDVSETLFFHHQGLMCWVLCSQCTNTTLITSSPDDSDRDILRSIEHQLRANMANHPRGLIMYYHCESLKLRKKMLSNIIGLVILIAQFNVPINTKTINKAWWALWYNSFQLDVRVIF
jgi:hypothetical protein